MTKVTGSRIATPLAPPRPGRTPMIVPNMMPRVAIIRLYGERAIWNPISRLVKASTGDALPGCYSLRCSPHHPLGMGIRNHLSKIR